MEGDSISGRIAEVCRGLGIHDIGVADAGMWETDPLVSSRIGRGGRPRDLMPDARSVVVIGIPIQRTVLDTAPSILYNHLYNTVNTMLDQAAERIALELISMGHHAVAIPRDGYLGLAGLRGDPSAFFSHRHAAYLAGMGTFGYNNMLLTERYGPRIRLASIVTSAKLPAGFPMDRQLCTGCRRCVRECPVNAVTDAGYPVGITEKQRCVEISASLAAKGVSPCGRCIAVCPIGDDRCPSPTKEAIDLIRSYVKPV